MMWSKNMRCIVVLSVALLAANACGAATGRPGVAVLLVDTDLVTGNIEEAIYGHFLEHINHSVVDGLFAEQIQGCGFEGKDFETYWRPFPDHGAVQLADVKFENGEKSVRIELNNGAAGIRQGRIYVQAGYEYNGSVWLKPEQGTVKVTFRVRDSNGKLMAEAPLTTSGSAWQEVRYAFSSTRTDGQAMVEIAAVGTGAILLDFRVGRPGAAVSRLMPIPPIPMCTPTPNGTSL